MVFKVIPKRWFFLQATHVWDDCQPRWNNILGNNSAHRRESSSSVRCTATTQLKAYTTQSTLSPEEESKRERQKETGDNTAVKLLSHTRLNRHKSCLSDSLNLPSCSIFRLIFCNCNTLRQPFSPLVNCTLQFTCYPEGERKTKAEGPTLTIERSHNFLDLKCMFILYSFEMPGG